MNGGLEAADGPQTVQEVGAHNPLVRIRGLLPSAGCYMSMLLVLTRRGKGD